MHGSAPKLMIIAKKESMGGDCPDFDGDSYLDAKKKMVKGDSAPESGHIESMREIAEALYKASEMHREQADKLMNMSGDSDDDGKDSDDMDEKSEDKPHKSYGDHNPYGSSKEY